MIVRSSLTALALAVASFGAQAQTDSQSGNDIITLSEWNYENLYEAGGIQSEYLIGAEVLGPGENEIGEVENVILNDQNQIVAIIAEVGGFWDIGDTHIAVPWEEVTLMDEGVQIPVTEENYDDYNLYDDNSFVTKADLQQSVEVDDDLSTGNQTWKLTSLVDDYATLSGGVGYGYVDNVIFSEAGKIKAVVVETAGRYGVGAYAYPFYGYGYGWNPAFNAYELPYDEAEVGEMEPFDFDQFGDTWDWD